MHKREERKCTFLKKKTVYRKIHSDTLWKKCTRHPLIQFDSLQRLFLHILQLSHRRRKKNAKIQDDNQRCHDGSPDTYL